MSNKKLTTEAKQLLLKAVIFADENTFHHPKDRLREIIENTEDLCIDDLVVYSSYLIRVINDYIESLNRQLDDCIGDDDKHSTRHQVRILSRLVEDLKSSVPYIQ